MLYGIIADVHSNLEALEAVLHELRKADRIVCLGDLVGYGPEPNECVEKIKELGLPTVAGNHDKAVVGEMELTWFNQNAKDAISWTQMKIFQENLEFLEQLPLELVESDFHMVHGSLRSPLEEYVGSVAEAIPTFEKMIRSLCFVGHDHIPLFIAQKFDGNYEGRRLVAGDEVIVNDFEKAIINVGAVGQPRDGDPRASFGIYDSRTKLFTLKRVEYDIGSVQEKMHKAGLPQPLIDRLQFGA